MSGWRAARCRTGWSAWHAAGTLRADADPQRLAASILAAVQGGLLLTQTEQALWPLEAALDGALGQLRAALAE